MAHGSDYQRVLQIYNWYRNARLSALYYEDAMGRWRKINQVHDGLIAFASASSPIAFWKHSQQPVLQQGWFYLTLIAAILGVLKPILRWDKNVTLFAELQTHYCDLYMDLKFLTEDIQAAQRLSPKMETYFEITRRKFKDLERKEPKPDTKKVQLFERRVNQEIDVTKCWFPER
jgi:hypothetical protein